jgi:polysaccharide chain length determinant protein (PEP-CTERM system associated)
LIAVLNLIRQQASAGWRNRWIALLLAWAICGLGWSGVYLMPNIYEASARLYVDTDAVLTPMLRGIALDNTRSHELEILQKTLLSRPNLQTLISKTSLDLVATNSDARNQLVEQLGKAIKIESQNQNLFSVVYRNKNPKLAHDVVQAILAIFMESAAGNNRSDMQNAQQFLDQQIAAYEQKLRAAEKRRADFMGKYVDLLPDANGGASRLELARTQVRTLTGELQDAIARHDMLAADLKTMPPILTADPESPVLIGGNLTTPLAEAERQLQELRLRYTEKDPDVIQARERLRLLETASKGGGGPLAGHTRSRSVANPIYEQLKIRLLDAGAAVASLERQVRDATAERDRLEAIARGEPELQAEALNIDRDYNVLKKDHEEMLARREATRIAAAADTEADKVKMRIVDPPEIPRVPVAPNRPLLMSGVLFVGIGSGVALAFVLAQLDQSFYTVQNLRSLGLPVLGGISTVQPARLKRRVASVLAFALGVMLLIAVFGGLITGALRLPKVV